MSSMDKKHGYSMVRYEEVPYDEVPRFSLYVAAHLAGVSPAMVRRLQAEGWVRPKPMPGGGLGYSIRDVRMLRRVREWRDLLGMNLAGIEVALRLREQVLALHEELLRLEEEMARREQELYREIQRLRQLVSEDAEWEL